MSTGKWQTVGRSGVLGTHAALLHTGQVLFFSRPETPSHNWGPESNGLAGDAQHNPKDSDASLSAVLELIAPDTYQATAVSIEYNPFCAGQTFLPDGRLLVAGGDKRSNLPNDFNAFQAAPIGTRYGTNRLRTFMPSMGGMGQWQDIGEISDSRWYPTCTLLPDGRVFVVSGSIDDMNDDYNTQNPTCENIPPSADGPQYLPLLVEAWPHHSYPFVHLLPSGALFLFAKNTAYYLTEGLDKHQHINWGVSKGPKLKPADNQPGSLEEPAKQYPNYATSVLLPLMPENDYAAEVMLMGGGGADVYPHWSTTPEAVSPTAPAENIEWRTHSETADDLSISIDLVPDLAVARKWATKTGDDGQPLIARQETFRVDALDSCFRLRTFPRREEEWRRVASMHYARVMPDSVLLPDGTVLVVNGTGKGFAGGYPAAGPMSALFAARTAELYDPRINTWQELAAATCSRLYHSTALLLPDARVLVAGSDHQVSQRDCPYKIGDPRFDQYMAAGFEFQVEIFTPPYLDPERGPRPVIQAAPERVAYQAAFEVQLADFATLHQELRVVLVKPSAVTHGNNMSQRVVGLKVVGLTPSGLTVEAPPNGNVAPPGYYMLFVLHAGVPSEARFVQFCLTPLEEPGLHKVPLAGLNAWLRADTGVVADSTGTVSSWMDLSGQGNDTFWVTSTADGQPQRPPHLVPYGLNNQPVVRFSFVSSLITSLDPQGGHLESGNKSFLPGSGPYTILIVAHPWPGGGIRDPNITPKGISGLLGWGDYNSNETNAVVAFCLGPGPWIQRLPTNPGKASVITYWDPQFPLRENSRQLGDHLHAPVSLTQAGLVENSFDGTQWAMRVNGEIVQGPVPVAGKNTGAGPLTIGRTGAFNKQIGEFFRGDIAEVLIYDRLLATDERLELEAYLRNRYDLP